MSQRRAAMLLAIAGITASGAAAADHWIYQYREFEVIADGSAAYARSIGRNLNALDETLRRMLQHDDGAVQPPTRVYALAADDLAAIDPGWGKAAGAFVRLGPFEHVLVQQSENAGRVDLRNVYAARARGWLEDQGLQLLPEWFKHGLELIAAEADFDNEQLTLGADPAKHAELMATNHWISLRRLLQAPPNDPEMHDSPETQALYDAQCWWLVHLMLFDHVLDQRMGNFIARQLRGEDVVTALVATYNAEFEDLDAYIRNMRRTAKLQTLRLPLPADADSIMPQPLGDSAFRGRLAQLVALRPDRASVAIERANQVLAQFPGEEHALRALAAVHLRSRQYQTLLGVLRQLAGLQELSPAGRCDLAVMLAAVATHRDAGVRELEAVDAAALRTQARAQLRLVLQPDTVDPRAAYAQGWLVAGQGDVAAVRESLPATEQAFHRWPHSLDLATLLVRMYTLTGNIDEQFKLAGTQQRLATTPLLRQQAARRVARLRPLLKAPVPEQGGAEFPLP